MTVNMTLIMSATMKFNCLASNVVTATSVFNVSIVKVVVPITALIYDATVQTAMAISRK
jgi:hypothetical protein